MPIVDVESSYVTEQDSRLFASRQILPFLFEPKEYDDRRRFRVQRRATSKSLLSLARIPKDAFTDCPEFFRWRTRPIYDVDGLLLFRDQTLSLGPREELRVRTAASDLLRSPVWSVKAGPAVDIDGLISKALSWVKAKGDLEPVMIGTETTPRVICYGYPKLGILCRSRKTDQRFVVDLWELVQIPADAEDKDAPPEFVRTVWSPFDYVTRGKRADLRVRFRQNIAALPSLPERFDTLKDLIKAIEEAGGTIKESRITYPELELEKQETNYFCAAATAKMILDFYNIQTAGGAELTQVMIYGAMADDETGATPQDQVNAIPGLTGNALTASLDSDPLFTEAADEIRADRPFKTGTVGHARACSGFLIEGSDKEWMYIYDPYPANEGAIYYEAFEIGYYVNYMYVQRVPNT